MSGKNYFLFVKSGAFVEKGESPESFTSVTGELMNITFKKSAHGEIIKLHIVNEQDFYMINLFVNSRAAYAFLMVTAGIDLTAPFTITIKSKDGKDHIDVYQNDTRIPWGCNYPGFITMQIDDKIRLLIARLHKDVLPVIIRKGNPFPLHPVYKPMLKLSKEASGTSYYATR